MKYIKLAVSIAWFIAMHHSLADPLILLTFRDFPTPTSPEHLQIAMITPLGAPKNLPVHSLRALCAET